jgi:hypothetical protein
MKMKKYSVFQVPRHLLSDKMLRKKQMDRRTVISKNAQTFSFLISRMLVLRKVIFSPDSGGRVNPSKDIAVVSRHGIIKLNPLIYALLTP